MATFTRNYIPDDMALLPADPRDWLPSGHLAYLVRDCVLCLDLSPFTGGAVVESRGAPAYPAQMMVSVIVYCLCRGAESSRRIEAMCSDDLGCRYLCGSCGTPSYRTFSGFAKRHRAALRGLLGQTARLCMRANLTDVSKLFLDGTKIKANASKDMNVAYAKIDARVAQIMATLERRDAEDEADDLCGGDGDGDDGCGPAKPERKAMIERRERLLCAKHQLESDAAAVKIEHEGRPKDERRHNPPAGVPGPRVMANATDPDSRLMGLADGSAVQGYNAQIVVEGKNRVIVAAWLSKNATDYGEVIPAIDSVERTLGHKPERLIADSGYFSKRNVRAANRLGVSVLMPPRRPDERVAFVPKDAPAPGELERLAPREQMQAILATQEGHDDYKARKSTVETVFAMLKGCPGSPGLRQFLRRGIANCLGDFLLACAVHNLKRYWSAMRSAQVITKTGIKRRLRRVKTSVELSMAM